MKDRAKERRGRLKIKHGSYSELDSQEYRERRSDEFQFSQMGVVNHPDYIGALYQKILEYDPDGKKASRIADKYSFKE